MYMEHLTKTFVSPQSINNYVSGIRILHKVLNIEAKALDSYEILMMARAIDLTFHHSPIHRPPMTIDLLRKIVSICNRLGQTGTMLKCAFIFLFMGFLRQSNIAPHSFSQFDIQRHTARGDVFHHPPGLILFIKWTKTLQSGSTALLPLQRLQGDILCPVDAFEKMISDIPAHSMSPLLVLGNSNKLTVVTISLLNKYLKSILMILGDNTPYTLHSFRSGGATFCFKEGALPQDIKIQGTWKSDVFWRYITPHPSQSTVPKTFKLLQNK
jgi:hypothetical protein